jgi:hypothetical protein
MPLGLSYKNLIDLPHIKQEISDKSVQMLR